MKNDVSGSALLPFMQKPTKVDGTMTRTTTVRKYGRTTRKQTAEVLFAQLPRTPVKTDPEPEPEPAQETGLDIGELPADEVNQLAQRLEATRLEDTSPGEEETEPHIPDQIPFLDKPAESKTEAAQDALPGEANHDDHHDQEEPEPEEHEASAYDDLRVLTWADVCPAGDRIEKIAEASYAEVYRITNAHGTSIIKVVRLQSPIKPQTKAQARSGLVDEEPHAEEDMQGELRISEWLADIPGFVVYKEQYVVQGKAPKALLETHQAFHRRVKRKDPDRLQFYPSPSRYLDGTRFLVVELGDAGTALEDFGLTSVSQVWDIFLHTALALARAEDLIEFEVSPLSLG
jgi:serine/threonine-protein kinase haspin